MSAEDIELINPNTRTCPIFRSRQDAEITKHIYRRVPVLVREATADSPGENPWGVSFHAMFHMANDSGLFHTREKLEAEGWRLMGNVFERAGQRMLPLYEAKMAYLFNHRHGDFADAPLGKRPHRLPAMPEERLRDPGYTAIPFYWVHENEVEKRLRDRWDRGWLLGWRDVTDARASVRTVVAAVIPRAAVNDKFLLSMPGYPRPWGLIASMMSLPLDFVARQKLGGLSLKYFTMRQLPFLSPSVFDANIPWSWQSTEGWLLPRLLELLYTAWDLQGFAADCGYAGPPFRWADDRRFLLQCELDAAFFHLYGVAKGHMSRILDTFDVLQRREERLFGQFRTKLQILDIYDRMQRAIETGEAYQTVLDPPPAHPSVAHPENTRPAWAVPRPARRALPELPALPPAVAPDGETVFVVWALLRERGERIARTDLARAFALRSNPDLLLRLAPAEVQEGARDWAARVGTRSVSGGTLARTLRALADRQGIRLATDDGGRSIVETTGHTPSADQLDPWYRFEARLALIVLDALAPDAASEVDASLRDEDRRLLAVGEV